MRAHEIFKEKQAKEKRGKEETIETIEITEPTERKSFWERFSGSYWELAFLVAFSIFCVCVYVCV